MEKERPLELVNLDQEISQRRDARGCQLDVFDFRLDQFDPIFDDVSIRVWHGFYQLVAHVFHLDLESGAEAGVPLLLHGRIADLVDVLRVDLEIQVERRLAIEGLLFELRNGDAEAKQHSLDRLAREVALHVRTDDFQLDLAEPVRDGHVEHLVDRVVEHFTLGFTLLLELPLDLRESLLIKANDLARRDDEGVTRDSNEERVRAGQVLESQDFQLELAKGISVG